MGGLLLEGKRPVRNHPFQWALGAFPLEALPSEVQNSSEDAAWELLSSKTKSQTADGDWAAGAGGLQPSLAAGLPSRADISCPASQNGPSLWKPSVFPEARRCQCDKKTKHRSTEHYSRKYSERGGGTAADLRTRTAARAPMKNYGKWKHCSDS